MAEDGKLKGSEKLTWTDQMRGHLKPTMLQTDSTTGEVYNPKRRFLEERIRVRIEEEKAAAEAAAKKK